MELPKRRKRGKPPTRPSPGKSVLVILSTEEHANLRVACARAGVSRQVFLRSEIVAATDRVLGA